VIFGSFLRRLQRNYPHVIESLFSFPLTSSTLMLSSLLQRPRNPPFPPTVAQPASQLWRAEIMKHPHHCFLKGNKRGQLNGLRLTSSGKTNQTLGIEHAHPHTRDPAPSHADTNSRASKRRTQEGTKLQRPCLRPTSSSPLLLPSRHASLRSSVLLFSLAWLVDASSAPRTSYIYPAVLPFISHLQLYDDR
jgi:hypothetical protein